MPLYPYIAVGAKISLEWDLSINEISKILESEDSDGILIHNESGYFWSHILLNSAQFTEITTKKDLLTGLIRRCFASQTDVMTFTYIKVG